MAAKTKKKDEAKATDEAALDQISRDLELRDPLEEGSDVKALQRALNGISDQFPKILQFELKVDGKFGERTFLAALKSAHVQGLVGHELDEIEKKKRLSRAVQRFLLDPSSRNEEQKERARKRRENLRKKAERRLSLKGVSLKGSSGDPHWGGAGDVMEEFVEPFLVKRGLQLGSGKRTPAQNEAVGGSESSDHLTTRTTCAARDFPTFQGEDDARALAKALGFDSWRPNSFDGFEFSVGDRRFRAQILWGTEIKHGDHVHVGVTVA
jgi:hypothetical protein